MLPAVFGSGRAQNDNSAASGWCISSIQEFRMIKAHKSLLALAAAAAATLGMTGTATAGGTTMA